MWSRKPTPVRARARARRRRARATGGRRSPWSSRSISAVRVMARLAILPGLHRRGVHARSPRPARSARRPRASAARRVADVDLGSCGGGSGATDSAGARSAPTPPVGSEWFEPAT